MKAGISHEQGGTHMVDPDRLDAEQRAELAAAMSARLDQGKVAKFLQRISDEVDIWENLSPEGANEKEVARKLRQIEAAARRLSSALSGIDKRTFDQFAVHFDTLLWVSEPQRPMPASMRRDKPECRQWLNEQLDALRAIETVAEYTIEKITPSNDPRSNRRLRELVRAIAWGYREAFGKYPPKSTWFYAFMRALGEQIGIAIGREIVLGVLSDLK